MQKRKEEEQDPEKIYTKESAISAGTVGGCNNLKHRTFGLVTRTNPKTNHSRKKENNAKLENS